MRTESMRTESPMPQLRKQRKIQQWIESVTQEETRACHADAATALLDPEAIHAFSPVVAQQSLRQRRARAGLLCPRHPPRRRSGLRPPRTRRDDPCTPTATPIAPAKTTSCRPCDCASSSPHKVAAHVLPCRGRCLRRRQCRHPQIREGVAMEAEVSDRAEREPAARNGRRGRVGGGDAGAEEVDLEKRIVV